MNALHTETPHKSDAWLQTPKVAIVGVQAQKIATFVREMRAALGEIDLVASDSDLDELQTTLMHNCPDILIVNAAALDGIVCTEIERLKILYPDLDVILIAEDRSPEFLLRAMRIGVCEVQPPSENVSELVEAIQRVISRHKRGVSTHREGKVLAFISCKGGGASFLAANFAYDLAEMGKQVILIDLNLQCGDSALFLTEERPTNTIADVAAQIERVDEVFLAASLIRVHPNLGVLAAPQDTANAQLITPHHIDILLRLCRKNYDYVVLDVGRTLSAMTVRALDCADTIYPIVQNSVLFIRDGQRLLETFRELGYSPKNIHLIVNRLEKQSMIPLQQLEETLGSKVYLTFPDDCKVAAESVNRGIPISRLARNSDIARKVREFAESMVGSQNATRKSWIDRMLRRA